MASYSFEPKPAPSVTDLRLLNRFISYPVVSSFLTNAKTYYDSVAEKHPAVKTASEKTLNYVQAGLQTFVLPTVQPVVKSDVYKKYSGVLLATVDEYGNSGLDTVEKLQTLTQSTLASSKQTLEKKVLQIKDQLHPSQLQENVVVPLDGYLKKSLIAIPIGRVLSMAEGLCDTYIPEKNLSNEGKEIPKEKDLKVGSSDGPVFRATKISKRLHNVAMSKLHNLSLRTPDRLNTMNHCVDLISYAANYLDKTVKKTSEFASEAKEFSSKSVVAVKNNLRENAKLKSLHQKIHNVKDHAYVVLVLAFDGIHNRLPASFHRVQLEERFKQLKKWSGDLYARRKVINLSEVMETSVTVVHQSLHRLASYDSTKSQVFSFTIMKIERGLDVLLSSKVHPLKKE